MREEKIFFLVQAVEAMNEAVLRLKKAEAGSEEAAKLKTFIIQLKEKIDEALK